jgi:ferritin-like metal-binding protein YciE
MPKVNSLKDLFVEELRDIYNAEHQLVQEMPKMAQQASSPELRSALEQHFEQTKGQIQRLDRVFQSLNLPSKGRECKGMEGLLNEAREVVREGNDPAVRDAALITAVQKTEHYEIASYGSACTFAKELGRKEQLDLLLQNLNEEKRADERLTEIAKSHVNRNAERG